MNGFDSSILTFLNQFAHRSRVFDTIMVLVCDTHILKGGVMMALLCWEWFREDERKSERREILLSSFLACFVAVFVARVLAHVLPFRERPLYNLELHFQMPYTFSPKELIGWSSFPSDHATLFFALATGILLESRFLGVLAVSYVLFFISLPRIYLGIHYPTDIIAGAVLGSGIAYLASLENVRSSVASRCLLWQQKHPSLFYALFFLLSYQIATLFDDVRGIGGAIFWMFSGMPTP